MSEKSPGVDRSAACSSEEKALEVERSRPWVNTKSSGDLPFITRRRIVTTDGARMVMVRRDFDVLGTCGDSARASRAWRSFRLVSHWGI